MRQLDFDAYAAELAKREAVTRVEQHADPDWKEYALATVKRVAMRYKEFTTDKVLDEMTDAPVTTHELRALGPVMSAAARRGYIVATDKFVTSTSVTRHRAPKRVWQSRIYEMRLQP